MNERKIFFEYFPPVINEYEPRKSGTVILRGWFMDGSVGSTWIVCNSEQEAIDLAHNVVINEESRISELRNAFCLFKNFMLETVEKNKAKSNVPIPGDDREYVPGDVYNNEGKYYEVSHANPPDYHHQEWSTFSTIVKDRKTDKQIGHIGVINYPDKVKSFMATNWRDESHSFNFRHAALGWIAACAYGNGDLFLVNQPK